MDVWPIPTNFDYIVGPLEKKEETSLVRHGVTIPAVLYSNADCTVQCKITLGFDTAPLQVILHLYDQPTRYRVTLLPKCDEQPMFTSADEMVKTWYCNGGVTIEVHCLHDPRHHGQDNEQFCRDNMPNEIALYYVQDQAGSTT